MKLQVLHLDLMISLGFSFTLFQYDPSVQVWYIYINMLPTLACLF